jgi:hypothetical protein
MSKVEDRPRLAERYSYSVRWSEDDAAFVATVAEFPSLSWIDEGRRTAEDGLVSLVADVLTDMHESGETPPEPFGQRTFSGKFNLRLPVGLHRELALKAERENQSLNSLVVSLLSRQA